MKHAFYNFKVAATGRWAVALPVFFLTLPFGLMVSIEREISFNPESSFTERTLIVSAGYFCSFLYIFTMQATLLKNRKKYSQPLWRCIFVWYSTGSVQGFFASFYAHYAYGYEWDVLIRVIMPTFYTGSALALIAFYFGSIERRRVEEQALQSLAELLAVDKGELVTSDARARAEAREALQKILKPQIEKLQGLISSLSQGEDGGSIALSIGDLNRQSVAIGRAVEREANAVSRSREIEIAQRHGKRDRISLLSGIFPHNLSVRIASLVIAFGAITGQLPRNGWEGVLAGLIGSSLIAALLYLLSHITQATSRRLQKRILLLSYLLVFLAQALWTYLQPVVGFTLDDPYHPIYSALKTIYGVYIASIVSSLVIDTSARLEESKLETSKELNEIAILTRDQEALDQHLFSTRFGALQGKISGVIMALQLLESTPDTHQLAEKRQGLLRDASILLTGALVEIAELGVASAH